MIGRQDDPVPGVNRGTQQMHVPARNAFDPESPIQVAGQVEAYEPRPHPPVVGAEKTVRLVDDDVLHNMMTESCRYLSGLKMHADEGNLVILAPGAALPRSALRFSFARSGGPGGQNVNKVNTKATMTVELADLAGVLDGPALLRLRRAAGRQLAGDRLIITSSASRSQIANRRACVDKLRRLVKRARHRPRPRKATRPSRGAVERRLKQKSHRAGVKRMRSERVNRHSDW